MLTVFNAIRTLHLPGVSFLVWSPINLQVVLFLFLYVSHNLSTAPQNDGAETL